jgi:hypothetical protein
VEIEITVPENMTTRDNTPEHAGEASLKPHAPQHIVRIKDTTLSTPSVRLMFQVVGAMAEFERALTQ